MEAPLEEGQDPKGAVVPYMDRRTDGRSVGRSVGRTDGWMDGRMVCSI